ncbi:MAG: pyridoxamine 5'-phosphate oxidase family protein [Maritimibacter sp.]|nr:pyridoxamine 5'-phosphate oxidase family protein [Maritimibacter sp.]
MPTQNPIRPTDDEARALARTLVDGATFAALAVISPETQGPTVTRIGFGTGTHGLPVTLISSLSAHTRALQANPACSLLIGEPGDKGDPLTHPRLTLDATAAFVSRGTPAHDALKSRWLTRHSKSRLYVDFADFGFVRFTPRAGFLNGGFGKAYRLAPHDLARPA